MGRSSPTPSVTTGLTDGVPAASFAPPVRSPPRVSSTSRLSLCFASDGSPARSERRFAAAVDDLETIELDRYPLLPLMRLAFELRSNVTAYDAAYIALAEILGCEILTGDHRLANATGPRCPIRLLD
jgi:hypothetical protein